MKKNIFLVTTIILAVLLAGAVGFAFWYDNHFYDTARAQIEELHQTYLERENDFIARYEALSKEKADVETELSRVSANLEVQTENLKRCEETLNQVNVERQAKVDAYNEWWNSLDEETQKAYDTVSRLNDLRKELLATNEEYAEIYEYIAGELDKTEFTLEERKTYQEKYRRMKEIETEYLQKEETDNKED